MKIQLSDHFTYQKLLRFVFPSIMMMIFTSIYGVIDGLFVSNFVGKTAFAAINLIMPVLMIIGGVGFMIGTGGSALVAKKLGEGRKEEANRCFSMMILLTLISGIAISAVAYVFMRPISYLLGATEEMIADCVIYGRIIIAFNTAFMLQNVFQSFLVTAEKPNLGLIVTVAAGLTNIALDALFVGWLRMGVVGAAVATGVSQSVGGIIPLIYFMRRNSSLLRMTKTRLELRPIVQACTNGASELMSNISGSVVSMVYNYQLIRLIGENGVAAYGVLMYVQFIFIALFIGYAIGSAPIVSYHYGAQNHAELKNMLKKSLILMSAAGILLCVLGYSLSDWMSRIFVGYDRELFDLTRHAFRIYSLIFILAGVNIFASSFFTALNNGVVSAIISFLRSLVFQLLSVLLLPLIFGVDGIWWSVAVADSLALAVTLAFLVGMRKKYRYW